MDGKLSMGSLESAYLGMLLEIRLAALFTERPMGDYPVINDCGNNWQAMLDCRLTMAAFPQIKSGFSIWSGMHAADRYQVLTKFDGLYSALPLVSRGNQKTLLFCTLFVHEFAALLVEAMDWPD